jgi:hypothetical protein
MNADKAEAKREREADKAETRASQEGMMAEKNANREMMAEMKTQINSLAYEMKAWRMEMKACREVTHAYLEDEKEPTPEETETVEKAQEFPKRGTDEVTNAGTEDRTGEQSLAVRHHRQRKKRPQVNGGPRRKFATVCGRFTRRAVPALLKGHVRKGPRRNRRSGVRGPGKTFRSRMEGRSLKHRKIQVNVARETPKERTCEKKGRTRPECNSGIRRLSKTSGNRRGGRSEKLDQRLKAKRMHREIMRGSLRREIAKLMIMSFIWIREPGNGTLWKCRPPPKRKM